MAECSIWTASPEANSLPDQFSRAFADSLFGDPLEALGQLNGTSKKRPKTASLELGSPEWLAQQTGAVLGSLPWYLGTHSLIGQATKQIYPKAAAFKLALTNSALTGFTVDSLFKPSNVDINNNDFLHQRLASGLSGALSFAAMTGMAGSLNQPILRCLNNATTESKIGNSALAQLIRHEAVSSRLAGMTAGAVVGAPTGFIQAQSSSLFRDGKWADGKAVSESMYAATLIGGAFGAFHKIPRPESSSEVARKGFIVETSEGIRQEVGSAQYILQPGDRLVHITPFLKIGKFECYRSSDIAHLENSLQHWKLESSTDALTKLPNNRAGEIVLQQNYQSAKRNNRPLSLVFMDLDGFKAVNDRIGHHEGNLVLQEVARKLQSQRRGQDTVYRKGGDEFVAILPETNYEGALKIAREIQEYVKLYIENPKRAETLTVGTSVGVCTYDPIKNPTQTIEEIMQNADILMYENKHHRKGAKYESVTEYLYPGS